MQSCTLLGVAALLLASSAVPSGDAQSCPQPTTDAMLTLTSRRNASGHWESGLILQPGGTAEQFSDEMTTGPFEVDLDHKTSTCNGKQIITIEATVIIPPRRAGPGYELVPGLGWYKFHTDLQVWDEARKICAQEGAHLAIINSENESKALQQMYARHPKIYEFAFIGFHDLYTEGSYVTIFGEPLASTGFTRWSIGQPNNIGPAPGEDCGSIHRNGGGLNDLICTAKCAYICEQELW